MQKNYIVRLKSVYPNRHERRRAHPDVMKRDPALRRGRRLLRIDAWGVPSSRGAHSDEIDHPFRSKPITRSDGNRSPVGASDAGPGIMSPGSLGSCRRSGLSHGLSLHVELERTHQRALTSRMLNAGRRGSRLGALPDFQEEDDDGLWALCETALFAVLQAPVGAVFASMGAVASTAPAAHRQRCSDRTGHGRRGMEVVCPRARRTRVSGLGLARPKRSVMSGRSSVGAQQRGTAVMSPGSRSESTVGGVCASSLP